MDKNCILFFTTLIVIFNLTKALVDNVNWCHKTCQTFYGPKTHTMCLYPYDSPDSRCKRVIRKQLTDDEIGVILGFHNDVRSKVHNGLETRGNPGPQPIARLRTEYLQWDNELAAIAQRWAYQCIDGNDECRDLDNVSAKNAVGQNVGSLKPEDPTEEVKLESIMQIWYDEVAKFNASEVFWYTGEDTSARRYTQMVWGKTSRIGCGLIEHLDTEGSRGFRTQLVCNYHPEGNLRGEGVY